MPNKSFWPTKVSVLSVGLLVGAVALLVLTIEDPEDQRLFFGLWRTRYFLLGLAILLTALALPIVTRSKGALFATFSVFVSTVLCWGFIELFGLGGIVSYPELFGQRDDPLGRVPQPNVSVSGQTFDDTASPWGLASKPLPFEYVTNSLGFRNVPDRTVADVYLLGDSILVSALVPFEETLTARLENQIGKPTMNIALIGISPRREQELFREASIQTNGKLVLQFIFEGNDLLDTGAEQAPKEEATSTPKQRTFAYNALMALQRLSQPVAGIARKRTCDIDGQIYTFAWTRDSFLGYEHHAQSIFADLETFNHSLERGGGTFGVIFVPAKLRALASVCEFPASSDLPPVERHLNPLREKLIRWGESEGVPVMDLTNAFVRAAQEGRIPWLPGDTHPNSIGHEVAAETISAWSLVQGWLSGEVSFNHARTFLDVRCNARHRSDSEAPGWCP